MKLIMFDFDGTLVDTAPDIITTTNLLLTRYGKPTLSAETIRAEIGTGLVTLLGDVFPESREDTKLRKELEEDFLSIYNEQLLVSPNPFPHAMEFLTDIAPTKNWKVAIVSNKRVRLIHPILTHLKMDQLPWVDVIGGDTCSAMKPHAEPFERAFRAAQALPHEAVIVGDGLPDIEGAKASGCYSIAVDFGYGAISELLAAGAHSHISNYQQLPAAIEALERSNY